MLLTQHYQLAIGLLALLCFALGWLWVSAEMEINKHIMVFYTQPRSRRRPQHRGIIRRVLRRLVADDDPATEAAKQYN